VHIHFDLAPLVALLTEAIRLLKEIRSTMPVNEQVAASFEALKTSVKQDITAETAQVVEAIRKAVEEGTSGAQAKIAELEALVVTLREQIAAGEDPTETLAMIDAGQAELRTAVQSIIADVLPDPQTTSRRR